MDEEISIPVNLPLDSDGFLRRECPTCERQFKWFANDEGDADLEALDQYFCPLCGIGAGSDSWWTTEQLDFIQGAAAPELDRIVQDGLKDAFKGVKGMSYKSNPNFTLGIETPDPLTEPDDMAIVETIWPSLNRRATQVSHSKFPTMLVASSIASYAVSASPSRTSYVLAGSTGLRIVPK